MSKAAVVLRQDHAGLPAAGRVRSPSPAGPLRSGIDLRVHARPGKGFAAISQDRKRPYPNWSANHGLFIFRQGIAAVKSVPDRATKIHPKFQILQSRMFQSELRAACGARETLAELFIPARRLAF
jgi:hypothetical protein